MPDAATGIARVPRVDEFPPATKSRVPRNSIEAANSFPAFPRGGARHPRPGRRAAAPAPHSAAQRDLAGRGRTFRSRGGGSAPPPAPAATPTPAAGHDGRRAGVLPPNARGCGEGTERAGERPPRAGWERSLLPQLPPAGVAGVTAASAASVPSLPVPGPGRSRRRRGPFGSAPTPPSGAAAQRGPSGGRILRGARLCRAAAPWAAQRPVVFLSVKKGTAS